MVNRFFCILLIGLQLLVACQDSAEPLPSENDCRDCSFSFYSNKAIEVGLNATNTVTLVEGSNLVFRFTRPVFNEGSELYEDRAILFEIGATWDPFEFSDNSLAQLFAHEGVDEDGPEGPGVMNFARSISVGTIEGRKLDDHSWEIILNNVETSFGKQHFQAIFTNK